MIEGEAEGAVLAALFNSYLQGDSESFTQLCADGRELVLACFPNWAKVPETLRDSEDQTRAYINFIFQIAAVMRQLGHDGPMNQLTGSDENPIERWNRDFAAARGCAQEGEHAESNRILLACLEDMDGARGTAVDNLRPKILGMLGTNCLYLRDLEQARRHTQSALAECERIGDPDGIRAYRENLDVLRAVDARLNISPSGADLLEVRSEVARAQDLSDLCMFRASSDLLDRLLSRLGEEADASVRHYKAKILGLLGANAFKMGSIESSARHTQAALNICTDTGDFDGIRIYEANLDTIARSEVTRIR